MGGFSHFLLDPVFRLDTDALETEGTGTGRFDLIHH